MYVYRYRFHGLFTQERAGRIASRGDHELVILRCPLSGVVVSLTRSRVNTYSNFEQMRDAE